MRTVLKNKGILTKGGRGIWVLHGEYPISAPNESRTNVKRAEDLDAEEEVSESEKWKKEAIDIITEKLTSNFFERLILILSILKEKGFSQVEVTRKTGDYWNIYQGSYS